MARGRPKNFRDPREHLKSIAVMSAQGDEPPLAKSEFYQAFPNYATEKASHDLYLQYYRNCELHQLEKKLHSLAKLDAMQGSPASLQTINRRVRRYTVGALGYGSLLVYLQAYASTLTAYFSKQIPALVEMQVEKQQQSRAWPASQFEKHFAKFSDADVFYEHYVTVFRKAINRR